MREARTPLALAAALLFFALLSTLAGGVNAAPDPVVDIGDSAVRLQPLGAIDGPGHFVGYNQGSVLAQIGPTQTAVALTQTAVAIGATQTALVPAGTQTAVAATATSAAATLTAGPGATQTAVAATQTAGPGATATANARLTQTAVARVTQTAQAALTQIVGGPTPTPTVVLAAGFQSGPCATRPGDVCTASGGVTGTATVISSMTFIFSATGPTNTVLNSRPVIFIPTTAGLEAFFTACTQVGTAAPFTTTCTGTTAGNILQGAVVTVRFATGTGIVDVTGTVLGPGPFGGAVIAPVVPPPALPAAVPQVAIPAVPRPPVQFIPSAPAPLLPPSQPLPPLQAGAPPARYPEIPVIPEADTVLLVFGGLVALGAIAVVRRRRTDA